ncbi:hypothetical protein ACIGN6_32245 [Streptomyces sp. NPDC053792]|uniref:hypothetical protein n=1 Tax=Streptomyces sp. NPDC053792 TaxID=3365716 RepID=UPI0037D4AD2E
MSTPEQDTPDWLRDVQEADAAQGRLHRAAEEIADRRALAIARGVADAGRGGRDTVAARLGYRVGAVDKALARARGATRPGFLPYDLTDRLFTLEIAEVTPLTAGQWRALHWLTRSLVVDATWLHDPAGLLADEVEDALLDDVDTTALAEAVRSWTRVQTIAVLEALRQDVDLTTLPTCP